MISLLRELSDIYKRRQRVAMQQCNCLQFDTTTAVPSPATDLRAVLITSSSSIVVSWTPPSGGTPPTGYIIYYEATSGGVDVGSATVSGASTSEVTITGRAGGVYTVRIVALSDQLPSNCSMVAETISGESTFDKGYAMFCKWLCK